MKWYYTWKTWSFSLTWIFSQVKMEIGGSFRMWWDLLCEAFKIGNVIKCRIENKERIMLGLIQWQGSFWIWIICIGQGPHLCECSSSFTSFLLLIISRSVQWAVVSGSMISQMIKWLRILETAMKDVRRGMQTTAK